MQLLVLGPVEASADGRSLPLGGTKPRAVLAMLGLEANRTVTADHLIEGLWGEDPPASATKLIQTYVWRLRTALDEDAGVEILTHGRGYELRIDPDAVDVRRFEQLLAAANRAGRPDAAREALALWRGPPLSDVAGEPFAAAEIRRLEELRLEAAELAIEADLAAGRHHEIAPEIDALIADHPLHERLYAQRMLALYRCGRQADALQSYREARRTLVGEIGVEPGPELQRLHEAILIQAPSIEYQPAAPELPRELDAAEAPPLAGRGEELDWLRAHWQRAQRGAGALLCLAGEPGIGKTRLAAEIAGEAHRDGATVLYVKGAQPGGTVLAAIAEARTPSQPTLLVVDDADQAGDDVHAEIGRLAGELPAVASLVLVTARDGTASARLRPSASRTLQPLGAAAARQIAVLYAPAAEVPVDALLDASGGVARRLHLAASEWARQEAARRVSADAGRVASTRTSARAMEAELAGSVADLQATRERAGLLSEDEDERDGPVVCPYKGLAPFDADDADYFFGREQLVAELVSRLVGAPLLAVIGPSGSGKSSVVRAGLLPALARGVLPGSEQWSCDLIRPGEHPLCELPAITSQSHTERRLLVVDQFEELFTTCADESERGEFIDALVDRARADAYLIVLAIRADFYGQCAAYPRLSALLAASHVLVGPMSRDELRRAIGRPAQRAGLQLESGLADRLLGDSEGEPGALPLLATALLELWQQRHGRRLRLAAYERTGGVRGAVARLAEAAYGRLDPEQRAVARRILLRLAGDDTHGAPVRRRVALAELDADRDHDGRRVLDVLAGGRIVTINEGTVEVAHEALMREWPRLRGWLEDDRDGRRLHRQLIQAAGDWNRRGRDPSDLYRGARLASALEWRASHEPEINAIEQQFLDAGRAAGERARRRLRLVLGGVIALLILAVGAAVVAVDQQGRARAEARVAEAQRVGAQALSEGQLDRSLLLARQGVALDDSAATRDNLLAVLRRSPAAIGVMQGDGDALTAIALHPDGRTLAIGDSNGTVLFLDAITGRRIGAPHQARSPSRITSLAFSPDGTRLASAGWDMTRGFVTLFDARTGRDIITLDAYEAAARVRFSPDSRVLAAEGVHQDVWDETQGVGDRTGTAHVVRWDARTGGPLDETDAAFPAPSTTLLGFIGSGARLVTSSTEEHATVIRDAATLRPLRRFKASGPAATLSPAAGLIAFGDPDGSVRLLDLGTGELRTAHGRHDGPVLALRFNAPGDRLVTAGRDERLIVWDPTRATALETLEARDTGPVQDLEVAGDSRTAYSAGRDGTVIAWDLTGERRWERPFDVAEPSSLPGPLATAAGGSHIAVVGESGFVDVFESGRLERTGRFQPLRGNALGAAVAPDGGTLAITTDAHNLELWDTRTGQLRQDPQIAHAHVPYAVTFSADGRWLATGGDDSFLHLWDARRGTMENNTTIGHVADLSLSPDGETLAVTHLRSNFSGGLEIRSVPSLQVRRTLPLPIGTVGRFSADGRSLVYAARDGRVWILDASTWRPRGRPLIAHPTIRTADLSPDGRLLATTSTDGTGRLWDVASRRPIGATLSGESGDPIAAAFVRDGRYLAVIHETGGVVWDVRPQSWARHACAVAGRPLARQEWESVLPQYDYAPACARR